MTNIFLRIDAEVFESVSLSMKLSLIKDMLVLVHTDRIKRSLLGCVHNIFSRGGCSVADITGVKICHNNALCDEELNFSIVMEEAMESGQKAL